ncbi:trace amine-associated receptor 13c-like [Lepisosteus oculatus]|uniref:trace amine-associated receptor 13c-like n=1 Tax=Lepisosteus oculatus TaxID=7918 RepID=UPI0035F52396
MVTLTVCGNLVVIISVSHFKQLHTPTNLILLSLAVADFLVGLIVLPLSMTALVETCWYYGDMLCSVYKFFDSVLISVSLSNLVLIAIDRYFAVCDPLLYSTKITVNVMHLLILFSWVLSPSYMLAFLYLNGNFDGADKLNSCLGECLFVVNEIWGIINLIISFILPCFTMIALYVKIFLVAKRHAKVISSSAERKHVRENTGKISKISERKAAKRLGIVVLAFLLCWIPFYIWTLIEGNLNVSMTAALFTPTVIVYLNSCVNPILYALLYPWFQKSLKLIFTFKICCTASSFINLFQDTHENVLYVG